MIIIYIQLSTEVILLPGIHYSNETVWLLELKNLVHYSE